MMPFSNPPCVRHKMGFLGTAAWYLYMEHKGGMFSKTM